MEAFTILEAGFAAVPVITKFKAGQLTPVETLAELCDVGAAKGLTLTDVGAVLRRFGPEISALLPKSA